MPMAITKREDGGVAIQYPFSESYYRLSKHRSCWLHTVAAVYARRRKITRQQANELRSFGLHRLVIQVLSLAVFDQREGLSAEMKLQKLLEKRKSKLAESSSAISKSFKEKVLAWIKNEKIFSKKYVIVPIVYWGHWNLLIICNLGKSFRSKAGRCLLLLDSLEMANPRRLEPDIRKFVIDIYRSEGRTENKNRISQIPFFVPKVPQQRNDKECGHYVLCFINLFVRGAPENFTIEGYPYFMKQNWFSLDCVGQLYEKLKSSRKRLLYD